MKNKILIAVGLLLLGGGIGYFAKSTKVETKVVEVVKTETKIQKGEVKVVYKEKITQKDGTIIEKETSKEESQTNIDQSSSSKTSSEKVVTNRVGLTIQALAISSYKNLRQPEYGVYASKRVIGNIVVGGGVTTDRALVTVGLEF